MAERCKTIQGDVFEVMKTLIQEGEKYDVVICDPPALIPAERDMKMASKPYARLNQMALRAVGRSGDSCVSLLLHTFEHGYAYGSCSLSRKAR